jgi:hypothetical protein
VYYFIWVFSIIPINQLYFYRNNDIIRIMKTKLNIQKLIGALKKSGVNMDFKESDDSIILGPKRFRYPSSPNDFEELPTNQGLILPHTSREQRKALQTKNISYLDLSGNLYYKTELIKILLEESSKARRSKKIKPSGTNLIRPTLLVSPNGLAFVEALFRVPENSLSLPALQFCKRHDLFQPKVSKIMTSFAVKTLLELKRKISTLPTDWWLYAFDSHITKRKMTAFFDVTQNYYSLLSETDKLAEEKILEKISTQYKDDVSPGPTMVAKSFGDIIDNNISLWVSPAAISQLKKEYKLVAGIKEGKRNWQIAVPPFDLVKEGLISHAKDEVRIDVKTNVLRAAWDLSYSEERLREIRSNILRKFLK